MTASTELPVMQREIWLAQLEKVLLDRLSRAAASLDALSLAQEVAATQRTTVDEVALALSRLSADVEQDPADGRLRLRQTA